jgi:glycine dehydrogenase subunit 1
MASSISNLDGYELVYDKNFINEFLVKTKLDVNLIKQKCIEHGFLIEPYDNNHILFSVTEKRTKDEIDQLISILGNIN